MTGVEVLDAPHRRPISRHPRQDVLSRLSQRLSIPDRPRPSSPFHTLVVGAGTPTTTILPPLVSRRMRSRHGGVWSGHDCRLQPDAHKR